MTSQKARWNRKNLGRIGSVFLLLAGILLLFTHLIPTLFSLAISFNNYTPAGGVFGSPWVGVKHYLAVTQTPQFLLAFRNSLVMGILGGILPILPGWLMGRAAANCGPKTSWVYTGGLLLPCFLPVELLTRLLLNITAAHVEGARVWLYYLAVAGIRTLFFTAFLSAAVGRLTAERHRDAETGAKWGAGFMLALGLIFLFSPNVQLCWLISSPLNLNYSQTLSIMQYRTGLLESNFSAQGAQWVLHLLIQLPGLSAGTLLMVRIFKKLAGTREKTEIIQPERARGGAFLWCAIAVAAAIIPLIGMPVAYMGGGEPFPVLESALGANASLLFTALFVTLLYLPATGWAGSLGGGVLIPLCLLLPLAGNIAGRYLLQRSLYLLDTHMAAAFAAICLPLALALSLLTRAAHPEKRGFISWLRDALPTLLLFLGLTAAESWGGEGMQRIYLRSREKLGLGFVLGEIQQGAQGQPAPHNYLPLLLWYVLPVGIFAILSVLAFGKLMDRRQKKRGDLHDQQSQ